MRVVDVVVRDGRVRRHAVVPEGDGALFPLDADLEILAQSDVLVLFLVSIGFMNVRDIGVEP